MATTFTYKFTPNDNNILNVSTNGNISIKNATSPNTPGTGAYTITITETVSGESYNTDVTVNVETLCKSIDLIVGDNTTTKYLTNYETYNIAYNVQYKSGNNYIVSDKYCKATYTVSSGVTLNKGNLSIPQLYEGAITITAINNQTQGTKSVSKTINAEVFKPKVTLTIPTTTYGTNTKLTYSVEGNAAVGDVKFNVIDSTYYSINGQTLTPLKAGRTSINTYYEASNNFPAYTSNDIWFTIDKRTGSYTFNPIEKTFGNSNFYVPLTYNNWFGSIGYDTGGNNASITVNQSTGYVNIAGAGKTTVTVTGTGDNNHKDFKVSADITIKKRSATSYSLADAKCTYGVGTYTMKLTHKDWNGTPEYSVPKNSSSYITINGVTGIATIKGAGKTTVTVIGKGDSNHNNFRADADIEIAKRSGKFTYSTKYLSYTNKGTTYSIGLTYTNWFGTGITYSITYNTGDDTISLTTDNKIKILNAGTATIKADCKGDNNHYTYTAYISCNVARANRTFRFAENPKIIYGDNYNMVAFEGNTSTTKIASGITYTSSNEKVATVNNTGAVTTIAYGTTVITGKWAGNRNYEQCSNTATVNVERKTAKLSLNDVTVTYSPNITYQLTLAENDTNGTISYTSDTENVATVDNSGLVKIKGAGSSKINVNSTQTGQYKSGTDECIFTVNAADTKLIVSRNSNLSSPITSSVNYTIGEELILYIARVVNGGVYNGTRIPISKGSTTVRSENNVVECYEILNEGYDDRLKLVIKTQAQPTNNSTDALTVTFTTNNVNYKEATDNIINLNINKATLDITASDIKFASPKTTPIIVTNTGDRTITAQFVNNPGNLFTKGTIYRTDANTTKINITTTKYPNSDTDGTIKITAEENNCYTLSEIIVGMRAYKYTGSGGDSGDGGTTDPDNTPDGGGGNNDQTKNPYLVIDGQPAYAQQTITLNPSSSTTSFNVKGHNVTGQPTVRIESNNDNIKEPSTKNFIAYNDCILTLTSAKTTRVTFSCSDNGFAIGNIYLDINYSSGGDSGGSPDTSVPPADDPFGWATAYINEVAYVVISSVNSKVLGVANMNRDIISNGADDNYIILTGGTNGIIGDYSISGETATVNWEITNANGDTKTIYNNEYIVIKGDMSVEPDAT